MTGTLGPIVEGYREMVERGERLETAAWRVVWASAGGDYGDLERAVCDLAAELESGRAGAQ